MAANAQPTLVKYGTPQLVSEQTKPKTAVTGTADAPQPTEDILHSILPPRQWESDGKLWAQHVSPEPATRLDVVSLQEQLDKQLTQRQARETGICPIREELYAQCFDELIRQATINCAERGLLLLRVRDEIREAIASYQTLYESSIAFGMRKALQAEQERAELAQKEKALAEECETLTRESADLEEKIANIAQTSKAKQDEATAKHKDEIAGLASQNTELKAQLEKLLSLPTKGKKK